MRGALSTARELGEKYLNLAQRQQNITAISTAAHLIGMPLFCLGELTTAREYYEQAYDCPVGPAWFALLLWHLGYLDQARKMIDEGLSRQLPSVLDQADRVHVCQYIFSVVP